MAWIWRSQDGQRWVEGAVGLNEVINDGFSEGMKHSGFEDREGELFLLIESFIVEE